MKSRKLALFLIALLILSRCLSFPYKMSFVLNIYTLKEQTLNWFLDYHGKQ